MTPARRMDLATAAMGGNKWALAELTKAYGAPQSLTDLHNHQRAAFDEMSPQARARDEAATTADLDAVCAGTVRS